MDTDDIPGINDFYEQATALRKRTNLVHAAAGVNFVDIDTAYIDEGVLIGKGTFIGPCVIIKGNSEIGEGVTIGSGVNIKDSKVGAGSNIDQNSRIDKSEIGEGTSVLSSVITESSVGAGSTVGPFAFLRPGSDVGKNVRIGDFVEIKNSGIGDGTKVSHLTYVGDSDLGKNINIGCGVVFVNYDGKEKHRSTVGDGAFIGCNVNIISPVAVGEKAYIAAGTTVTKDVPGGSLCIGRSRERSIPGWIEKKGLV